MRPDKYGRSVSYLRLSVTDRCNLRCFYCQGGQQLSLMPHQDILRYEEMLQLIGLAGKLGVRKVRLTGGEPLVRRDVLPFLERVLIQNPGLDLRLTTNATLLPGKAKLLKQYGLSRVNISLDTLERKKYEDITRRDYYMDVRRAIDECLEEGLLVKVNAVALRGVNDVELADFVALARQLPLDMRFIEFMPMGQGTAWSDGNFWSAQDIVAEASRHADLTPIPRSTSEVMGEADTHGPARMYSIADGKGRFGVISPLSDHFCGSCNRLRITSDGRLRTCLFSDRQYRLRPLLRHPKLGVEQVRKVIERAGQRKPLGHMLLAQALQNGPVCNTRMSGIGG